MAIDFKPGQWEEVKRTYDRWWSRELDRPVVPVELTGREPGRPKPDVPLLSQATCTDLSFTAEEIIDRLDYELSTRVFLGDAFPYVNLAAFGPGIMAAFCGARIDNSTGSVWFFPQEERPITDIHLQYDPDNVWLRRIKDICRAALDRWQGQVLVGMPDLGGALDIAATFVSTDQLLLNFYDHPDEVKRLTEEIHDLWHHFYREISAILEPVNPGYSDWSAIFSDRPSYMLQCDLCYMISPAMFDTFVKPELESSCRKLDRGFYHLDGPGQIAHLDSLLEIEELQGVQWVPGAGNPTCEAWPEIYRKIAASGRLIQVLNEDLAQLRQVVDSMGGGRGIHGVRNLAPIEEESDVRRQLEALGC